MKLKVCGMQYSENIKELVQLEPDYLGFIFYDKSKRNYVGEIPALPNKIKKTGVFVNETKEEVLRKLVKYDLQAIQLHGEESVDYCKELKETFQKQTEIIKVFSVGTSFDFEVLKKYDTVCDFYLFDTKGKEKGGNGITFNWGILKENKSQKPYFLSGGIGLDEVDKLKNFLQQDYAKNCVAIDVNSRFEIEPGLKNIEELKTFQQEIIKNEI